MADYIERQAAVSRFEQLKEQADTLRDKLYLDGVMAVIDALPAANVREDVQGKWIDFRGKPQCFNCKAVWPEDYYQHNFCPHCGARMAGGCER